MVDGSGSGVLVGGVDVFAAFDESVGKSGSTVDDVWPVLARYRHDDPIHRGDIMEEEWGSHSIAAIWAAEHDTPIFSVFRHPDVLAVLRDPATFSSEVYMPSLGRLQGRSFMIMDPPQHTAYRGLVAQQFSKRSSESMRTEMVVPAVDAELDHLATLGGRADLFRDYALRFPISVLHRILGLNERDAEEFLALGVSSLLFGTRPEVAQAGAARLRELLHADVAGRRAGRYRQPGLMQDLVEATLGGRALTEEEIVPYLGVLLAAGAETAMRSTCNLLLALLRDDESRDLVVARPEVMGRAVEEALRWEPPILANFRATTADAELGGVTIPSGSAVVVWIGSANHDEAVFSDPERFDIGRDPKAQVAFGFGVHLCIGMHLARIETASAVGRLFERYPEVRIDPDAPPPLVMGHSFRSPVGLPVLL